MGSKPTARNTNNIKLFARGNTSESTKYRMGDPVPEFKEISEAESFIKQQLKIKRVDYTGLAIEQANLINRTLLEEAARNPEFDLYIHEIIPHSGAKTKSAFSLGFLGNGNPVFSLHFNAHQLSTRQEGNKYAEHVPYDAVDLLSGPDKILQGLLLHEVGHMRLYVAENMSRNSKLNKAQKEDLWILTTMLERPDKYATNLVDDASGKNGATTINENFAESFVLYRLAPEMLKSKMNLAFDGLFKRN